VGLPTGVDHTVFGIVKCLVNSFGFPDIPKIKEVLSKLIVIQGCKNVICGAILLALLALWQSKGYEFTEGEVQSFHSFLMDCGGTHRVHRVALHFLDFTRLGTWDPRAFFSGNYWDNVFQDEVSLYAEVILGISPEHIPSSFEDILEGVHVCITQFCDNSYEVFWQWAEQVHWMIIHMGIRATTLFELMPYLTTLSLEGAEALIAMVKRELTREQGSLIVATSKNSQEKAQIFQDFVNAAKTSFSVDLSPLVDTPTNHSPNQCVVDGCEKGRVFDGMCVACAKAAGLEVPAHLLCVVDGCKKFRVFDGMCLACAKAAGKKMPPSLKCVVDGCEKGRKADGMCLACAKAAGLEVPAHLLCVVDGCKKFRQFDGMCLACAKAAGKKMPPSLKCVVDGCEKGRIRDGMCRACAKAAGSEVPAHLLCVVDGCKKLRVRDGMCVACAKAAGSEVPAHLLCVVDGCKKLRKADGMCVACAKAAGLEVPARLLCVVDGCKKGRVFDDMCVVCAKAAGKKMPPSLKCVVDGCEKRHKFQGKWCQAHFRSEVFEKL
jgi:hypothetical protein